MNRSIEVEQKMVEALEKLEQSPAMRALREEERQSLIAKRTRAVEEIKRLRAELGTLPLPDHVGQEEREEIKRLEERQRALKEAIRNHRTEAYRQRDRVETEIRELDRQLLQSYHPAIDAAIDWFIDKTYELRHAPIRYNYETGKINLIDLREPFTGFSNRDALGQALDYCRKAKELLEDAKLAPSIDEAQIEQLKAAVPDHREEAKSGEGTVYREPEEVRAAREAFYAEQQRETNLADLLTKVGRILKKRR
jgi:hypothetical protein